MPPDEATSVSPSIAQLPRNVKLLGCASLLNDIASEMVFPLLPQFLISVLGGSRTYLGLIEGLAESTSSLVKLWSGHQSDKSGRRKSFVIGGYALAGLARPLIGLTGAVWQVFLLRIADRIGKGLRTSPRDALIAETTAPGLRGRAFGFHRAMDHLGAAIGPLLATAFLLLWPNQLRTLFLLTLLPGIVVVAFLAMGLSEVPRVETVARERADPQPFWSFGRDFRIYLVALVLFTLGNSSDAFLLLRAGDLGVATPLLPLLWCVFHVAKSMGNMLAGGFVDRFGAKPMILVGWLVYALVYLAFALATSAWQVWLLFLAYAAFYALTEPAEKTLVARFVGREQVGVAYGWFHLAVGITSLPASLVFGWLYQQFGAGVAFGWSATLALIAAVLLAMIRQQSEASSGDP